MKKTIECEVRTFVTKDEYTMLLNYFSEHAEMISEDTQESHYFNCQEDLRIQKNKKYAKIWLKKGLMHADNREEIEIKCDRDNFNELAKLFYELGYSVQIKWFRDRKMFKWEDIDVAVDYTKGYGYILELEKMSTEEDKEETVNYLTSKLRGFDLEISSPEEFTKKFEHYKENWQTLII